MTELSCSLSELVFLIARNGMEELLLPLLSKITKNVVKKVLKEEVINKEGERFTPLILAALKGHNKVVELFLSECDADIEQEGSVKIGDSVIEGASALWCAAEAGHLNVVKTLVMFRAKVNHATLQNSTPLRVACFHGRLDIVQYLIEHGADVHIANKYNNTCLMIAAYKGHLDVVRFLLKKGARTDENCNPRSTTAIHEAAEGGHLRIVQELLNYGAQITKNGLGMTPLLVAAANTQADVVQFLVTRPEVTLEEKIDALELLGASYTNTDNHYCLNSAYQFLHQAMQLRWSDPIHPILKQEESPVSAYEDRVECGNLQELEEIQNNSNALHMESLTIIERILGEHNPQVFYCVLLKGAFFADNKKFDRCIKLWLHALDLKERNSISVTKNLLRFAQLFSQMISEGEELSYSDVRNVLAAAVIELERNKDKIDDPEPTDDVAQITEDMESNMLTTLYLLIIFTKHVMKTCNENEQKAFHRLVSRINKSQVTSRQGQTLLHLCVNAETPVDKDFTDKVCKFPCSATAEVLIQCGANVIAKDNNGRTPLDIIASNQEPNRGDRGRIRRFVRDNNELEGVRDNTELEGVRDNTEHNQGIADPQRQASEASCTLI